MFLRLVMIQEASWHRDGMFMGGVHWAWWLFIIVGVVVLLWAFARVVADRDATRKNAARLLQAEADLRARFESGEITEEQLTSQLAALLGIGPTQGAR
jgi:uncharacterized membrane protein